MTPYPSHFIGAPFNTTQLVLPPLLSATLFPVISTLALAPIRALRVGDLLPRPTPLFSASGFLPPCPSAPQYFPQSNTPA
jgi:hypothetical protein